MWALKINKKCIMTDGCWIKTALQSASPHLDDPDLLPNGSKWNTLWMGLYLLHKKNI